MGGDAVVELAGENSTIELGNDCFLPRQRDPDDGDGGRRGDLRPAGQHRRRQAQLLSTYSSSFCSFSGKNTSFVRTLFSVSSLLLISLTVPAIVIDETPTPLFILHIRLFVPVPHCLTLCVLLGNSLPLPKPCSHIFFSSLCQVPCLISLYYNNYLSFFPTICLLLLGP